MKIVDGPQELLDRTVIRFNTWRLKVKSQSNSNHKISTNYPELRMENKSIVFHDCVKYLGVNIDHELNFKTNASETNKKCNTRSKHFPSLTQELVPKHLHIFISPYVTLF